MPLAEYRRKRKFRDTPEPRGQRHPTPGPLRFVVQKHDASRLHYDFRLELGDTLKSWAVPKGPSMRPGDKRLAIRVEDHPLDYRTFEGVIPAGNYGAGTVMVWDEGTYRSAVSDDPREDERILKEQLEKGDLKFILDGQKLRGEFALVKLRKGEKNAWLLLKKRDQFSSQEDITAQDQSAASGRTLDEIATQGGGKVKIRKSATRSQPSDLSAFPEGEMLHGVKPMLATLVNQPFDGPGWLFEIKWDGYRAIAEIRKGRVHLYSRNLLTYNDRYRPVIDALAALKHDAVLDGEVVVLDEAGKPQFQLLQNYQKAHKGQIAYYVFDLLYLDGHSLLETPLSRRKQLLMEIIPQSAILRLSEHILEHGVFFFHAVAEQGLEGVMAKRAESRYRPGVRSCDWLKMKTQFRQEAVIGGFTKGKGGRRYFGALVLGVYENERLVYIGHTGGGFSEETLARVHAKLLPLVQKECPFDKRPATNAPVQWVRPELVCEVAFRGWSDDGHMRQPIFVDLRDNQLPRNVRREVPKKVEDSEEKMTDAKSAKPEQKPRAKRQMGDGTSSQVSAADGHDVTLTNLQKVYWPERNYTKGDLVAYYREVGSIMVPYLRDRPESLNRHPNGIHGKNFFQKNVEFEVPEWVETASVSSESRGEDMRFLLCQNESTLLYLANLGCIEINPWSSRVGSLDKPDFVVIDLDPEDVAFDQVVQTARVVRKVLDKAGAEGFCKTSGKRGLHIYIPVGARYDYEHARRFAEIIARLVNAELPAITSLVRNPAHRQKRVYLDFLQNARGQTLAAPYSVRPTPEATVSTPLKWQEVKRGLDPARFTIRTIAKRLDKVGDLWSPVLRSGVDIKESLAQLTK